MKKLTKKQFFLAISAGILLLLFIILYWLKEIEWITFLKIEKVRLHQNWAYALGAPEFFQFPHTYSRFWDIFFLPVFIFALIWSRKKVKNKANLWILSGEMLGLLIFYHFLTSNILTIYVGLLFVGICGLVFNEFTGIFLALVFGLIVGLTGFGLLFGILFSISAYLVYLALKFLFA